MRKVGSQIGEAIIMFRPLTFRAITVKQNSQFSTTARITIFTVFKTDIRVYQIQSEVFMVTDQTLSAITEKQ